ncbi:MAG: helix-turn-helix transcriptional regulator [Burkholderiaceae bacterium]
MRGSNAGRRLSDATFDQCVADIYSAASGETRWEEVCDSISSAMDLCGIHIIGLSKKSGQLLFSWEGGALSKEAFFDYVTHYHPENPRLTYALSLQGEEWVHDHFLFDDKFVQESPFFQEFAIPYGARFLSGTKLVDDEDHVVMFGAIRSTTQVPLNEDEMKTMCRFRLHLVKAMAIHLRLREAFKSLSVGHDLLNALPYPIFVVNLTGQITHQNRLAAETAGFSDFIHTNSRRFELSDRSANTSFAQKLQEIERTHRSDGKPAAGNFIVPIGDALTPAVVIGVVVDPDESMQSFGIETLVLVIVHEISKQSSIDPFIVGKIFNLTPAESFVATTLANGSSADTIASERGVSVQTIRSQVRSIYAKIGIHSQAELTNKIMNIPKFLPRSS